MKLAPGLHLLTILWAGGFACTPKDFASRDLSQGSQSRGASDVKSSMETAPTMPAPMPKAEPLMEEALPPVVVSGASLQCMRTPIENEIDCFMTDDLGTVATLPKNYEMTFYYEAADAMSGVMELAAERRDLNGTHYFLSIKGLGDGSITAAISNSGEGISHSPLSIDISAVAKAPAPQSSQTSLSQEYSLAPQTHFGDDNNSEGDNCSSALASGTAGPTAGFKFHVEKKLKDARIVFKGICGIQSSKTVISLIDSGGTKQADITIAAGSQDFLIFEGTLDPGDYSLLIDSSASLLADGTQDNFTIQTLGFSYSKDQKDAIVNFLRTN